MQKTISVIIPSYNVSTYIGRCLDSVVNQTLYDIEIIIVDDGSTDGTYNIAKSYADVDDRIILIQQEHKGQSCARNRGLEIAKGEYVAFIDSDDFIDVEFLEELYVTAKDHDSDIACSGVVRENSRKKRILINYKNREKSVNLEDKFKQAHLPKHCYSCNKIYKRESLINEGIKFPEGMYYEDMVFTPLALSRLNGLVTVPNVLYHYWKNPKSTIKKDSDDIRGDKIEAQKNLLDFYKKNNLKLPKDYLLLKKDFYLFGIKVLSEKKYKMCSKMYLLGFIPFLRVRS